ADQEQDPRRPVAAHDQRDGRGAGRAGRGAERRQVGRGPAARGPRPRHPRGVRGRSRHGPEGAGGERRLGRPPRGAGGAVLPRRRRWWPAGPSGDAGPL
ncbi:MAG: FIG018229: hypothetical protein, partial [uncultured Rubellimicrobium sp.]